MAALLVDLGIGDECRRAPGQQFNDTILAECQVEMDIIPEGASFNRIEQQPAAPLEAPPDAPARCGADDEVEAPDEDVEAPRLVDEVRGARPRKMGRDGRGKAPDGGGGAPGFCG